MKKTKITRSWSSTVKQLLIGIALLGVSVLMFATIVEGLISGTFAVVIGIGGVMVLVMAATSSGVAACPGCDAALSGLSTGSNDGVCCQACHRYSEGKGGELWLTDLARVADTTIFKSELPEKFAWPDGCCVCTAPVTRQIPVTTTRPAALKNAGITAVTGGAVVASGGGTKFTVEVPHCAQHDNGASLLAGAERVDISFRSYPFLRAFCERNATQPR